MSKIVKLLVFELQNLNLALPVDLVERVVNYTPVFSSGTSCTGIAQVGDRDITVIDLYSRLFKSVQPWEAGRKGYLIITHNTTGESFGILVPQAPSIADVPLDNFRVLPESYRRSDTLSVATHVIHLPSALQELTIFYLDVNLLLPAVGVSF